MTSLDFPQFAAGRRALAGIALTVVAAGAIVFGDALARKAGAMVSAQRQQEMAWVFATDAATVARDGQAAVSRLSWDASALALRDVVHEAGRG